VRPCIIRPVGAAAYIIYDRNDDRTLIAGRWQGAAAPIAPPSVRGRGGGGKAHD